MRLPHKGFFILLFAMALGWSAIAQQGSPPDRPAADLKPSPVTLTGKERLGAKWTDEQRIDNCKVPVDKRGSKPRSSACPHIPES